MNFRLSPQVEVELDGIWLYIARQSGSFEIADRVIDSITERFQLLARHPQVGRRRDHDLKSGLRSFAVREYVIIFRQEGDGIHILHVMRGSRDIEGLMDD